MSKSVVARHPETQPLAALVEGAARALLDARTAAEVLDARRTAAAVVGHAKVQARLLKEREAHADVIAAVRRMQGDALCIEQGANQRIANEVDAAQARGEVRTRADNQLVPDGNKLGMADLGLTRKDVHEARRVRDAERVSPGVVRRAVDEQLAAGAEPTKAAIGRAVDNVLHLGDRLKVVPGFEEIERELDAEEAAERARSRYEYDAGNLQHRALAISDAMRRFDFVHLTGKEYWSVYGKSPEQEVLIKWVLAAKSAVDDILDAYGRTMLGTHAHNETKPVGAGGKVSANREHRSDCNYAHAEAAAPERTANLAAVTTNVVSLAGHRGGLTPSEPDLDEDGERPFTFDRNDASDRAELLLVTISALADMPAVQPADIRSWLRNANAAHETVQKYRDRLSRVTRNLHNILEDF